jgi:hypothetical protein
MNSDIYGQPRMERVFNRLLDIKKIAGGSGEMFWKGGFPGLSLEAMPEADEQITFDPEATKDQMEKYMNGLQRYLALVGMQAKTLTVQVADPTPHLDVQLRLIATALGVPWRVFIGSEQSELASTQDTRRWNKRLVHRRETYLTPYLIRPLVDRLSAAGALPTPKELIVKWPDPEAPNKTEQTQLAQQASEAMAKYVQSGSDVLMSPFHFLTLILGMSDDEATAVVEAASSEQERLDRPEMEAELQMRRESDAVRAEIAAGRQNGGPPPRR